MKKAFIISLENGVHREYAIPVEMKQRLERLSKRSQMLSSTFLEQVLRYNREINPKLMRLANKANKMQSDYKQWCIDYAKKYPMQ